MKAKERSRRQYRKARDKAPTREAKRSPGRPRGTHRKASPIMEMFRTNLADARRAAGLTQAAAAKIAGVTQACWSAYEVGVKVPGLAQADKMATVVGIDLWKLLLKEPPAKPKK